MKKSTVVLAVLGAFTVPVFCYQTVKAQSHPSIRKVMNWACGVILLGLVMNAIYVWTPLTFSQIHALLLILMYMGLIALVPWQVGFWISGYDPKRSNFSEGFRLGGPLVLSILPTVLYGVADWALSIANSWG